MNKKLTAGLTLGLLVVAPFSSAMNAQEVSTNVLKETAESVSKDLKSSATIGGTPLDSMLSVDIDQEVYSDEEYALSFDNTLTITANITAEKDMDVNGLQAEVLTLNQQLNKDAYNVKVVDPLADVIAADTTDTFKAEISLNPDLGFVINPDGTTPAEMVSTSPVDAYVFKLTLDGKSQFYYNESFSKFELDGSSKTSVSSQTIDVDYDGDTTATAQIKNTGSNTVYPSFLSVSGYTPEGVFSATIDGINVDDYFVETNTDLIILQPGETIDYTVTFKGESLASYYDDTFDIKSVIEFTDVFNNEVESNVTVNFNEASTTTGGGDTTTDGGGDTTTDGGDTTTGDKPFVEQTSTSNTASTAKSTSPVLANTGKEISPIAITGLVSIIGFSILKFKNKLV